MISLRKLLPIREHCGTCPEDMDEAVGGAWGGAHGANPRIKTYKVPGSRHQQQRDEPHGEMIGAVTALHKEVKNLNRMTSYEVGQLEKWVRLVNKTGGHWDKKNAQALEKIARSIHHRSAKITEIVAKINEYSQ